MGGINFKPSNDFEAKLANRIAGKLTEKFDESDGAKDGNFEKQDEIYQALGVNDKDNAQTSGNAHDVKQPPSAVIYRAISSMVNDILTSKFDVSNLENILKKFNININVRNLILQEFNQMIQEEPEGTYIPAFSSDNQHPHPHSIDEQVNSQLYKKDPRIEQSKKFAEIIMQKEREEQDIENGNQTK